MKQFILFRILMIPVLLLKLFLPRSMLVNRIAFEVIKWTIFGGKGKWYGYK
jgi:hypothetical protein